MRRTLIAGVALVAASSLGTAQLSGNYTIAATGGNYSSFKAATVDLYLQGIGGPVSFLVLPGIYKESFFWFPAQGMSANTPILVHNPIRRGVRLEGTGADIVTILGTPAMPASWVTWEGIEFDQGVSAFYSNGQTAHSWVIRHCSFGPNFSAGGRSYTSVFYMNASNQANDWEIHHNKFVLPRWVSGSGGEFMYSQGSYRWDIHHNEIDLNGAHQAFSVWNANSSNMRIRNNLIYGSLRDNAASHFIRHNVSHYDTELSHNTFFIDTGASNSAIFQFGGCCAGASVPTGRGSIFFSNIVYWTGPTAKAIQLTTTTAQYYFGDGNIFWNPAFTPVTLLVGRDTTTSTDYDLIGWRAFVAATSLMPAHTDSASRAIDPILVRPIFPYLAGSLNVRPNSPAKDAGVQFPGYPSFPANPVTTDFRGRFRDDKPDIGAYELSGYAVFGQGCPGSGNAVPAMGYQGTVAIPSTNFAVTASNGLGGAPAILLFGTSLRSFAGLPLPLSLGGGCNLLTDITASIGSGMVGTGPGGGTARLFLPIVNNPALTGADLFFQWLVVDSQSGSPLGVAVSNGGALQL